MKVAAFLGVGEISDVFHLEFPILFNNSKDGERIIVELIVVVRVKYGRPLFVIKF